MHLLYCTLTTLYQLTAFMDKAITIKDIAKVFGVSVSTVSRALQNRPGISEQRRREIQEYARLHRYQPNEMATNLRSTRGTRTQLIGVLVPQFTHHYFSRVLTGIEETCRLAGYRIITAQSNDSYEREVQILQSFRQARVHGILLSQAKDTVCFDHYNEALADGIPLTFFDRICPEIRSNRIVVDDYQGAFTATEHLIQCGCRRICLFSATMQLEISKNRYNGYKDALLKHGIAPDSKLVFICDNREEAERIIPSIMSHVNHPDGFFTTNDDAALGVLYACKRMGFTIPNEVKICGFTNDITSRCSDPQITTIEQRGETVGQMAAQSLINQIEGKLPEGRFENHIVKTELIVRGTTKVHSNKIT